MARKIPVAWLVALALIGLAAAAQAEETCCTYRFSFRHDDIVTCAAFAADGKSLATGSEAGTVILTDMTARTETAFKNPDSFGNGVQALCFSRDAALLFAGGCGNNNGGGQIRVLKTADHSLAATLDTLHETVDALRVSPDNAWLISGSDSAVRVWNYPKNLIRTKLLLPDSTWEYDGGRTLFIGVGKVDAGAKLEVLNPGEAGASVPVSPGQIVLFDIVDGTVHQIFQTLPSEPIRRVVLAKAKKELFVLTDGATVYRLDRDTGKVIQKLALDALHPNKLGVRRNMDFQVLEDRPILAINERTVTSFINYETRELKPFDHQSSVGLEFSPTGREFAILGGIKRDALTGVKDQHYWTVNVFEFKPF